MTDELDMKMGEMLDTTRTQTSRARFACAKALGSASSAVLKNVLHRSAGNFPGKIALYADSNLLAHVRSRMSCGSILVVGTNGKTTVTLMIADMMEAQGYSVVCNRTGANLDSGIASVLLQQPENNPAQWGVFETDEMWLARVLPYLQSEYVVLLNLFPDQEDRMNIADIQRSIVSALASSPKTTVLYNADDPNCAFIVDQVRNPSIALGTRTGFFGDELAPRQRCPRCEHRVSVGKLGEKRKYNTDSEDIRRAQAACDVLEYSLHQYDQLGDYLCPTCGFTRAELDFIVDDVQITKAAAERNAASEESNEAACVEPRETPNEKPDEASLAFTLIQQRPVQSTWRLHVPTTAKYMAYNMAFVAAVACLLDLDKDVVQKTINAFNPNNGRLQVLTVQGHETLINLAKNPSGFNQNIRLMIEHDGPVEAAFFVNNKEGDGRSLLWLNDVNFELLAELENCHVYAGGSCGEAVASRFARAGMNAIIVHNAAEVFANAAVSGGSKVFLIANYTALPAARADAMRLANE